MSAQLDADLVVVGAGAAGLAVAIFAAQHEPKPHVLALDSAPRLGAKILVSGGGRCNVTNRIVEAKDFNSSSPAIVRRTLAAWNVESTVTFFREIGVLLKEERQGKMFPTSDKAATVLSAMDNETKRLNIAVMTGQRVRKLSPDKDHWIIETEDRRFHCRSVCLCCGGMSLPKSGSDGSGYELSRQLGHTVVPPIPALVPLVLDGDFHRSLSGISHPAEIVIRAIGNKPKRFAGDLLWTHFGISGPVAMNASGTWLRLRQQDPSASFSVSFFPRLSWEVLENKFLELSAEQPRLPIRKAIQCLASGSSAPVALPHNLALALLRSSALDPDVTLSQLKRDVRRTLVQKLVNWPVPIRSDRGWNYAEVTAGGVPLQEINPKNFESRKHSGLFFAGEILDVDGRIGGFNFQWAWSSAFVAAKGIRDYLLKYAH